MSHGSLANASEPCLQQRLSEASGKGLTQTAHSNAKFQSEPCKIVGDFFACEGEVIPAAVHVSTTLTSRGKTVEGMAGQQ